MAIALPNFAAGCLSGIKSIWERGETAEDEPDAEDVPKKNIRPKGGGNFAAAAAGMAHAILVHESGQAVVFGHNGSGQCEVPALPRWRRYIAAAGGGVHTVLLRDDGVAVAFGGNNRGQCAVPDFNDRSLDPAGKTPCYDPLLKALPPSVTPWVAPLVRRMCQPKGTATGYAAVAAGLSHTVLVRHDGRAVAFGANEHGQCNVPALDENTRYVAAAAGEGHTVLLKDDGTVVAFGSNLHGQCGVPALREGARYVHAAAAMTHTILVKDDGSVVVCGGRNGNAVDASSFPSLPQGRKYVRGATGAGHYLLLRDDGKVVASGINITGQCDVPEAAEGKRCTSIACGGGFSMMVMENGEVYAFGSNQAGQCNVPEVKG